MPLSRARSHYVDLSLKESNSEPLLLFLKVYIILRLGKIKIEPQVPSYQSPRTPSHTQTNNLTPLQLEHPYHTHRDKFYSSSTVLKLKLDQKR